MMNLDRNEVQTWVGELVAKEKDELIVDLMVEHWPRSGHGAAAAFPRGTID